MISSLFRWSFCVYWVSCRCWCCADQWKLSWCPSGAAGCTHSHWSAEGWKKPPPAPCRCPRWRGRVEWSWVWSIAASLCSCTKGRSTWIGSGVPRRKRCVDPGSPAHPRCLPLRFLHRNRMEWRRRRPGLRSSDCVHPPDHYELIEPSAQHPASRPLHSWSWTAAPLSWGRLRSQPGPSGCRWSWRPHTLAGSAELARSAALHSPRSRWWWAWWSSSSKLEKRSSLQSVRRPAPLHTVCSCRIWSRWSPCWPWRPQCAACQGTSSGGEAGTWQRCWCAHQRSGTWPKWEGCPGERRAYRTSSLHLCWGLHGHILRVRKETGAGLLGQN